VRTLGNYNSPLTIKKACIAFVFLILMIIPIYSNTFHAAWQFDDKPNIIDNHYLHLKDLHPQSLMNTFFTQPKNPWETGNKLHRPIACLTFALNWFLGQDNVVGYHAVNLIIHHLTAFLLFLTILNLFKSLNLKNRFDGGEYFIALLAATIWAVNPIQTQAVTYIVQRMTSLAAMFYILSMFLYVKCRLSNSSLHRILFLLGCGLAFIFALGSKENTATLPAALLLVEVTCFQDLSLQRTRKVFFWGSIAGVAFLISLSLWLFIPDNPFAFIKTYNHRPFSLSERLLTEPRIVLFYLSQIFFPLPGRLSIDHDVIIFTSLFEPWTTLPAILITLSLIGFGFSQIRKRPLIALAVLFFYLNHVIESTFIALELIFEHRNYLPSLFLFLPIAAGFLKLLDYYKERNPAIRAVLVGFGVLFIIAIGTGTYIRNRAWATEISLWADAMVKAPRSARPLTNLAWQKTFGPDGGPDQYDAALKLYEKALSLQKSRSSINSVIMENMAGIYFRKGEPLKAIELLEKALAISPDYAKGRYDLAEYLITQRRWNEASAHADYLLSKHDGHEGYLNLKGLILLHQKRYDGAIVFFRKSLSTAPLSKKTWLGLGVAYGLKGDYNRAEMLLWRAHRIPPINMMALFGLIENSLNAGNIEQAKRFADTLLNMSNIAAIESQLKSLSNNYLIPPLSLELISQLIGSRWKEKSRSISEIQN
jgi:tetratricopeptide (TPR) repeat protein